MATSSQNKFGLSPLFDRVVVEVEMEPTMTPSGLAIAISAEPTNVGKVVAIGPDVDAVSVGNRVLFAKYTGTEVRLDTKPYLVLKSYEVIGVLNG